MSEASTSSSLEYAWENKFFCREMILALNILHVVRKATSAEARRAPVERQYGYVWPQLKELLFRLQPETMWFLRETGSHSAVAGEMYPDTVRAIHALLKANVATLSDIVLDVDNLLKSSTVWPNGHMSSQHKRNALHELLVHIQGGQISESMFR